MMNNIFIDTSAFIALYFTDDDFHGKAVKILKKLRAKQAALITSNFILDEAYTFFRAKTNKKTAIGFAEFLAENTDIIKIIRVTVGDEQEAFKYFEALDGKGVSFTDCTSFALMKRLKIKRVFTFDKDFAKAEFKVFA